MKEQMRIELHNETEYTERISFQDIWTHASRLKYAGCRVAAITDRNSVDGIHMAVHDFTMIRKEYFHEWSRCRR